MRRRDGAQRWSLLHDIDRPERWLERFHSVAWLDHVRGHVWPTVADRAARKIVATLTEGTQAVSRMIERRPADIARQGGERQSIDRPA